MTDFEKLPHEPPTPFRRPSLARRPPPVAGFTVRTFAALFARLFPGRGFRSSRKAPRGYSWALAPRAPKAAPFFVPVLEGARHAWGQPREAHPDAPRLRAR